MKIGVLGSNGKMGKILQSLIEDGIFPKRGEESKLLECDGIIDFSSPEGTLDFLEKFQTSIPFVCGTTGFTEPQWAELKQYGENRPILHGNNFALHLHFFAKALEVVSQGFNGDVCLLDLHHRNKKDSPSGTAKTLIEKMNQPVSVQNFRVGSVIGTHQVRFLGEFDEILLEHRSNDRRLFAKGAIDALIWLKREKTKGFFEIKDVFEYIKN